MRIWHPREIWTSPALRTPRHFRRDRARSASAGTPSRSRGEPRGHWAWVPWVILSVIVAIWGTGWFKALVNPIFTWSYPIPGLHNMVQKVAPVVAEADGGARRLRLHLHVLHRHGLLIAAIIAGFVMGFSPLRLITAWRDDLGAALLADHHRRDAGDRHADALLGRRCDARPCLRRNRLLYPFFGTLLGWLGVALTGSDTASNVLFGGLQKITSEQLGLSPILMGAANSSGGVMGKMIDAQSIVVASTATNWFGHEGTILRFVFWHSIALACLVGVPGDAAGLCPPVHAMVLH